MAPLAHTLALLAMTVAIAAITELPLDMAKDSFDDQYQGCVPAMTKALPAVNETEFQQNKVYAQTWVKATAEWQRRGSHLPPLSSSVQAIALMTYTMDDLYREFNKAVREGGRSRQEYRDNFHFKTLHFLLTQALGKLRSAEGQKCYDVCRGVNGIRFKAKRDDIVRFGQFTSTSLGTIPDECFGTDTVFQVRTCHGADIQKFSYYPSEEEVLIPPYETFKVTKVTEEGNKVQIYLSSTGTSSNYNCEWLRH